MPIPQPRLRLRRPGTTGALALATLALAALPLRADETPADARHPTTLQIEVEDADGGSLRLNLSAGWLGALIETADIECQAAADRQARRMMASLQAQGEGGVYDFEDEDDGERVIARRSRGALEIEAVDEEGERTTIELPWAAAECLFLGIEPPGDLGRRIARGEARLELDAREDGSRVRISLR